MVPYLRELTAPLSVLASMQIGTELLDIIVQYEHGQV